jgi:hypothetical protein
LDVVASTLRDAIQSFPARTKFKIDNKGHIMFLIVELVNIVQAVKESEIRYFLEILNLSGHDLKRMLFILQCVDLIGREDYSGETFYAPRKKSIPRISFSANKERTSRFDRDRLISTFLNYANTNDNKRNFVIRKRAQ